VFPPAGFRKGTLNDLYFQAVAVRPRCGPRTVTQPHSPAIGKIHFARLRRKSQYSHGPTVNILYYIGVPDARVPRSFFFPARLGPVCVWADLVLKFVALNLRSEPSPQALARGRPLRRRPHGDPVLASGFTTARLLRAISPVLVSACRVRSPSNKLAWCAVLLRGRADSVNLEQTTTRCRRSMGTRTRRRTRALSPLLSLTAGRRAHLASRPSASARGASNQFRRRAWP